MGCTWKDCEGQARTEVAARCSRYSFQNALQVLVDYWLNVVNGDHSNPEKYAKTVQCFLACLEVTSKLWNDNAGKFWPTDKRVTIGNRTANSTAVAAMEYFHNVARVLIDGPMADAKAYGDNEISHEQLKRFKHSMVGHFSELGVPAKPGEVLGILDNIELSIGIEADLARSLQASIACKRLEHLRELFLHVNEDPKLLTAAMVEGGIMLVPLIKLGSIPNNEVFRDYIEAATKQPVPHFDTSVSDFSYRCMFQLAADMFSDKRRTILHKLSDNGEGVSCWSTSKDDTKRQSHQYASFCAELVEFLSVPAAAPVVVPAESLLAFTNAELMSELAKVIKTNKEKHWKANELRLKILECNPGRTTSVKSIEKNLVYKTLLETQGRQRKRKIDPDVLHDVVSQSLREHAAENGVRIKGRRIQSRD